MRLIDTAINNYIELDPEAPARLSQFEGRLIAIDFSGINRSLYLAVENSRINVTDRAEREPDARIIGSPVALMKLGIRREAAPLFFSGEVEIRGDTRLGRQFKALLSDVQIDWEEQLASLIGDIAAHRLFGLLGSARRWGASAADNFSADVGEYLQEESRDVVSGAELEGFLQQVDELRDDVDRLAARLQKLTAADPGGRRQ